MQKDIEVRLGPRRRKRPDTVVADRNSTQTPVSRARIVLPRVQGRGPAEVMRRTGASKPFVWRCQCRLIEAHIDGLLRDKTRTSGTAPVADPVVAGLIARTLASPKPFIWTADPDIIVAVVDRPQRAANRK